mgnify:CR=1 FL=1
MEAMMIETTVNMSGAMRQEVVRAARMAGVPASALVVAVMKRLMREHRRLARDGRSVEYQKKSGREKWRRLHISIDFRDYEFFVDMRKVSRRSVSFLVVIALNKYLAEVLTALNRPDYNEEADNYPFLHYLLFSNSVPGAVCWTIYWGMPENLTLHNPHIPENA